MVYHAMREIYMMTVLNLKTAKDRCPPHTKDSYETDFKVGDMVLLENHTLTTAFDVKYKASYGICNDFLIKSLTYKITQEG